MKSLMTSVLAISIVGSTLMASAQTKFPLRVDVDVSTKRSRRTIGAGRDGEAKVENVQVIVKIRKASGQPWDDPVTAELYVIGKEIHTGHYVVIDTKKGSGTFDKAKDNAYEYRSPLYPIGKTSGNINVGGTYETYLVVITDHEGKIVTTRSGRSLNDKQIEFIRTLGPLTKFDRDGNVLSVGDGQQEAFKKAIPSATDPGNDY
ncbi:hypothetical protein P4B35_10615 [Pontiellaceae bacterium B12227]|nr:hypothetical protein [Pontiellaceae bacterium B12227]